MKEKGERIVMLTCYDALFARLLDASGVDVLLVGDSVNQVLAGAESTLSATLDQMIYHTKIVRRGAQRAMVVCDMPYLTYQVTKEEAIRNGGRVMAETGCHAIKVEGGRPIADTVRAVVDVGIPVMGHIGLTPQSVHALGGYRVQGRDDKTAQRLKDDARALEDAGAFAVVLELVPAPLAAEITKSLAIPTIGFLQEGHLRLVDRARELADRVVLSVFVNPLQFGPQEDFSRYPRDLDRDRRLAHARSVDCLFAPERSAMYPADPIARVAAGPMADVLEGKIRPGHFSGVLTVVAKLFHVVEPDVALFGRKDFQQAMLVQRLVRDLDFPLEIEVAPTVRELDGLALSSRNTYLSPDERRSALALSRALRAVEQAWRGGQAEAAALQKKGMETLAAPGVQPEYVALVDEAMQPVERVTAKTIVAVAARIGATRLIDNVVLGEGIAADPAVRA